MTTFSKNVGPNSTTNFTKGCSESKPQGGGSTPNQGLARVVSVIKEAHSTLILVNCKHVLPPCPRPLILRMLNPAPPNPTWVFSSILSNQGLAKGGRCRGRLYKCQGQYALQMTVRP